jgi:hypothetical protein
VGIESFGLIISKNEQASMFPTLLCAVEGGNSGGPCVIVHPS